MAHRVAVFREMVTRAERWQRAALRGITSHARDDWRAAAWMLERKHPDQYGRRQRAELDGHVETGSNDKLDLTKLADDELEQLERLHERAAA